MGNYRLTKEAEADLDRIWLYGLEHWGAAEADKYYNALFQRFEELAESPLLYPAVDDLREGYRRSICGVDSIYYRVHGDTVEIMSILGRQDTDEAL
jgi:toxin ParE1/3/4